MLRGGLNQFREWTLWLRQVERVGTLALQKALNASFAISKDLPQGGGAIFNAPIRKFAVVDELMDEMYGTCNGRNGRFKSQRNYKILCKTPETEQNGNLITHFLVATQLQLSKLLALQSGCYSHLPEAWSRAHS